MNLSKRIMLVVIALLIFVAGGLGLAAITLGGNALTLQAEENLVSQSKDGARLISTLVEARLQLLAELAKRDAVQSMQGPLQRLSLQPDVVRLGFLDLGIVAMDGMVTYVGRGNTANLSALEHVQLALAGTPNVSDVTIDQVTGEAVFMYAVPITSPGGQVTGALIALRDGSALSAITDTMGFGKTGYAYLINQNGTVVAHPNRQFVLDQFTPIAASETDPSLLPVANAFRKILAEQTGVGEYTFNGNNLYSGFSPVEGTPWIFVTIADQAEVLGGLNTLRNTLTLGTLFFLVIGAGIAFMVARSISKPVTDLSEILVRLSNHDLTFDENSPAVAYLSRKDEIGTITVALATMQQNLVELIKHISESAQQVASSAEELTATSQQSAAAAIEVAKTIEDIASGATDQARETEIGVNRISELGQTIENDLQYLKALNQSALQVDRLQEAGTASLKHVIEKTRQNYEASRQVADIIDRTNESANQIQKASAMIQSIADQTNLLALNAAIESARAGEAGRGFAVVADEIRKLAVQSSQFTQEIHSIVSDLTSKTATAVTTMHNVQGIVEAQKTGVEDTTLKFRGISESLGEMQQAIEDLNKSGAVMDIKKNEIITVIEALSAISEENAAGTEEASASVEEQTAAMDEIARASETLSQLAEEMQKGIQRFTY